MKNTTINLGVVRKIAHALGSLNSQVVYVGGAVVSLYVNDPAAEDVRPTKDVDITLKIVSLVELEKLRQELVKKGFIQSFEDKVICRFRFEDILVDVMSTQPVGWAPSNPWFEPGFKNIELVQIKNETISILSLPYFLATKFSAFKDRGFGDPRTSHDFEDITYILDNRIDLVQELSSSPDDVNEFLKDAFNEILNSDTMKEAILGNLFYETQTERFNQIIKKLQDFLR
jgi:predicted nucleotidyltransferase